MLKMAENVAICGSATSPLVWDAQNRRKCRVLEASDTADGRLMLKIGENVAFFGRATSATAVRRSKSGRPSRSGGQRRRRGPSDGEHQRKRRDLRPSDGAEGRRTLEIQRKNRDLGASDGGEGRHTVKISENVEIWGPPTAPRIVRRSKSATMSRSEGRRRRRRPSDGQKQ